MQIEFKIEHVDSLGQGVSKLGDKVTFIPKTLPGEAGIAEVISVKKGVQFARLIKLTEPSPTRRSSECPHYDMCSGCHFLHTDYKTELEIKKHNFIFQLRQLKFTGEAMIHGAPERFQYRNRVQLHYDRKTQKLGFFKQQTHEIVEVTQCLLPTPAVKKTMDTIYQDKKWRNLAKNDSGHIEIYERQPGQISMVADQFYAHGGFDQVNIEMNLTLRKLVTQMASETSGSVMDLFGGQGNLSTDLKNETLVVDFYGDQAPDLRPHQKFLSLNLYGKHALEKLAKHSKMRPSLIIIDPPRSGLENLKAFIDHYSPEEFIYVSCQFSTAIRDSRSLIGQYELIDAHLVDLFPSTFHFETVLHFKKSKS